MEDFPFTIAETEAHVNNDETRTAVVQNNLGVNCCSSGEFCKAVKHFEECLSISKSTGDKKMQGLALGNLATSYYLLQQYDRSVDCLEARLTIFEGNRQEEREIHGTLFSCHHLLGHYEKTKKCMETYLTISQDLGDKDGAFSAYAILGMLSLSDSNQEKALCYFKACKKIADELGNKALGACSNGYMGIVYETLGHYDKAIKPLQAYLSLMKDIKDEHGESLANQMLWGCYVCLSQYQRAMEHCDEALQMARNIGNKLLEMQACFTLGNCYSSVGLFEKAIEYLNASLVIAREIENRTFEGESHGSIGTWYIHLGQYNQAIQHLKTHLAIAKELGHKEGESRACYRLGECYTYLNNVTEAVTYFDRNLTIAKKIGRKKCEGRANGSLGSCYRYEGKHEETLKFHRTHLAIAKEIGDKDEESTAQSNLGVDYMTIDQFEKAIPHIEMQLTIAKETKAVRKEGQSYELLGVCYMCLYQYDHAENNLRKAVSCYERLFESAPIADEYTISVFCTFENIYRLLTTTLLAKKDICAALVVADEGRSRALVKLIRDNNTTESKAPTPVHMNLYDLYEVASVSGSTYIFFVTLVCYVCTWTIKADGYITLRMDDGSLLPLSRPHGDSGFLVSHLTALINTLVRLMTSCGPVTCEDRSLAFLYADKPDEKRGGPSPSPCGTDLDDSRFFSGIHGAETEENEADRSSTAPARSPAEKEQLTVYESTVAALNSLLKDLYELLLAPVRKDVLGSRVVIVPDGPLALVPFAALVDDKGRYVSESLQVRLTPSLTIAKLIRERPENLSGRGRPLVLGDPAIGRIVMDSGKVISVPKLEWAKKEIDMISSWLDADLLRGKGATKENFLQKAEHAALIHVAAHGHAQRGEILLAPSAVSQQVPHLKDILLTIADLERRRINAKLVVLSCCHSGRGDVTAEGVIGIGRAFLGAGARAVLVSLWAVNDGATICFMHCFYDHLIAGVSANEALSRSMKTIREVERFRHPRYWAPFVLLGEDVTFTDLKKPELGTSQA